MNRRRIQRAGSPTIRTPRPSPSRRCSTANGQDGLLTCSLRPHLIWGPRDQHLIPRLIERARRGQLRQVGDGTNLIDAVYVENAAAAHLLAADALAPGSPVGGKAYFITNGEPVNCWQWINEILALAGLPPVSRRISLRSRLRRRGGARRTLDASSAAPTSRG